MLISAWDENDSSFTGEPTVNLLPSSITPIFSSWGSSTSGTSTWFTSPENTQGAYLNLTACDGGVAWVVGNNAIYPMGTSITTNGVSKTFTVSATLKYTAGVSQNLFYIREYNSSSVQLREYGIFTHSQEKTYMGDWKRVWASLTTLADCFFFTITSYQYSPAQIWVYNFQIEQNSHPTQFTSSSRGSIISAGGGLPDVVSGSCPFVLDSGTNALFDSNGKHYFNGSNYLFQLRKIPTTNTARDGDCWATVVPPINVTGTSEEGPIKNGITWKFQKDGTSYQWCGWKNVVDATRNLNSGECLTISFWYKTLAPAGLTGFSANGMWTTNWSRSIDTTLIQSSLGIIADDKWHFAYSIQRTNENLGSGGAILVDGPSWNYSPQAGLLYVNALQVEKLPYFTAYTPPGTPRTITDPNDLSLVDFSNFTISFWMKPTAIESYRNPVDCNYLASGNNAGPRFELDGAGNFGVCMGQSLSSYTGWTISSSIQPNTWYHVAMTKYKNTVQCYLNGVQTVNTICPLGHTGRFNNVVQGLGFSSSSERWFKGYVSCLSLYNHPLSYPEIRNKYKIGRFDHP